MKNIKDIDLDLLALLSKHHNVTYILLKTLLRTAYQQGNFKGCLETNNYPSVFLAMLNRNFLISRHVVILEHPKIFINLEYLIKDNPFYNSFRPFLESQAVLKAYFNGQNNTLKHFFQETNYTSQDWEDFLNKFDKRFKGLSKE